jgi:hypothetical protein
VKEALAHFQMMWLPCVALVLFFAVFCGALLRVFRPSNAELFQNMAELPLGDEEKSK